MDPETKALSAAQTRKYSGLRVDYSGANDDAELVRLWLQRYATAPGSPDQGTPGKLTPSATQLAYERDWRVFRQALDQAGAPALQAVTLRDVYQALDELGKRCSVETFRRRVFAVKSLFSFAHRTGYLLFNVTSVVRPPPSANRLAERILPPERIYELIAATPEGPKRVLVRLLYIAGIRVSEAVQLQGKDVVEREGERVQITIHGKGGKTRHVLLTPGISSDLLALRGEPREFLFRELCPRSGNRSSRAVRVRAAQRVVQAAAQAAGIKLPVSPHWMRHAHVSHALDHGAPLHVVQSTVGHASPATTSRYTHVRPTATSADYIER